MTQQSSSLLCCGRRKKGGQLSELRPVVRHAEARGAGLTFMISLAEMRPLLSVIGDLAASSSTFCERDRYAAADSTERTESWEAQKAGNSSRSAKDRTSARASAMPRALVPGMIKWQYTHSCHSGLGRLRPVRVGTG